MIKGKALCRSPTWTIKVLGQGMPSVQSTVSPWNNSSFHFPTPPFRVESDLLRGLVGGDIRGWQHSLMSHDFDVQLDRAAESLQRPRFRNWRQEKQAGGWRMLFQLVSLQDGRRSVYLCAPVLSTHNWPLQGLGAWTFVPLISLNPANEFK